jgi:uncharacterized membrane protein YraQ (UPF0718 family)
MGLNTVSESIRYFAIIMAELASLFLGISFLVEVMRSYLPVEKVQKHLSSKKLLSCVAGGLFGAITPFCSCSTIPLLIGMFEAGVPFRATVSFLLASPLLNPIILGLFAAMFGIKITAVYAGSCLIFAIIAGLAWESLGLFEYVRRVRLKRTTTDEVDSVIPGTKDSGLQGLEVVKSAWGEAWSGFLTALPYMLVGTAIGATLYGVVPAEWIAKVAGKDNLLAVPAAAVLGIPLYVRTETMIPIGTLLVKKGMSMGAVMALIIGGAGASIPEVSMLGTIFKSRLVAVFVMTIFAIATATGMIFNLASL